MRQPRSPVGLARHEGWGLFSAAEAMVKGVLEADSAVDLIAGPPRAAFSPLFEAGVDDEVAALLERHGLTLLATPDAGRAVALAAQRAVAGRRTFALVPNDELDLGMPALRRAAAAALQEGGTLGLVLEDDPEANSSTCPRQTAERLHLPCLEPADVEGLRDAMEHVLRLSRAARGPVALVVHHGVLRSAETLEARPNRVLDPVTAATVRPRRTARWAETGDVLRISRRLELNRFKTVPSPGERLPVGFVVVGPAAAAIDHVIHTLRLHGRVPVLRLGLLHPIDESVVGRLLSRCQQVVVLEPRPGSVEAGLLRVGEAMRRRGEHTASLSAQAFYDAEAEAAMCLQPGEALHPSVLARRIVPLLHLIRPRLELPFVPDPPALPVPPPPRGQGLGSAGALAALRAILADVDQQLRDREPGEDDEAAERIALAVDGAEPQGAGAGRVVWVETWPYRRFLEEGLGAVCQAAWDDRPWMFVVSAVGAQDPGDLERLARGAIPGERAGGARLEVADLNDRPALRELLQRLATSARLSVVFVHDGPPPRFDVAALDEARAEIDRLGYEPRQRLVRPVDTVCSVHQAGEPAAPPGTTEALPLRNQLAVGRSRRAPGQIRLKLRTLAEQVEVVRDQPPTSAWRAALTGRPAVPRPIHGSASQWRAHLAGFRGSGPGVAARILCDAGRAMGYQVRYVYDAAPIGPGRRAWAQVLFTRPGRQHAVSPISARIPYGEADLLVGLDRYEALRAVDPAEALRVAGLDRTCAVANLGTYADDVDAPPSAPGAARATAALEAVTRDGHRLLGDFAAETRSAFHTDRVADLALLGAAYQLGFVPLSLEAVEDAVRQAEARGFGRAAEAFRFGRHLAVDARAFSRPASARSGDGAAQPRGGDVDRLVRRTLLLLRCLRWGGRPAVVRFGELLRGTLERMPGLAETDPGREARHDFVVAMHHCVLWGGLAYARRYAELVAALYRADRGDRGRALTRCAILPLAEAMLVRDPIYVGTLLTSPWHLRRARRRLNIRLARGDRVQRRFLLRMELTALRRRWRADVRTSDWPAWLAAAVRQPVPQRWRGSRLERRIREFVIDVVERAVPGAAADYPRWAEALQRLHDQATQDRLRNMAISELRMLLPPETAG